MAGLYGKEIPARPADPREVTRRRQSLWERYGREDLAEVIDRYL
jgi:hypothetical protein